MPAVPASVAACKSSRPGGAGHATYDLFRSGKRATSLDLDKLGRPLTGRDAVLGGVLWRISHAGWNRLMHALHGNTASGSGGPPLLPAWLHRPGWTGAPVIEGRITGHWRAMAAPPAPIFDIWSWEPPSTSAQSPAPGPAPALVVGAGPVGQSAEAPHLEMFGRWNRLWPLSGTPS